MVICVRILLRWYNIALDFIGGGFIGRLYVIDYLYNSMTNFTENSRVKLPLILHFERLGYKYLSLKDWNWVKSGENRLKIFVELKKS